jgi:elongation factor G
LRKTRKAFCFFKKKVIFNSVLIETLEPFMDMDVTMLDEYCGVLLADLKSRKADVNQVSSNGKTTTIEASMSMINVFGYATWMRHITKGMASFSMNYHDHLDIQA